MPGEGKAYALVHDLVTDNLDHVKALLGADGVYEHVSMDAREKTEANGRVLVLWVLKGTKSVAARDCAYMVGRWADCGRAGGLADGHMGRKLTCPAVSTISVWYSWPLTIMSFVKACSIVG